MDLKLLLLTNLVISLTQATSVPTSAVYTPPGCRIFAFLNAHHLIGRQQSDISEEVGSETIPLTNEETPEFKGHGPADLDDVQDNYEPYNEDVQKRFILDMKPLNLSGLHFSNLNFPININMTAFYLSTEKSVKDAVKAYVPPTKEMAKTCRINITTASRQEMEFLRSVRAHYDICYMCDDFEENCTTVGICPKSSSCYRGESYDIRLWPTLTGDMRLLHPPAVTHGCCDTSKSHCRSGTHLVYDPNNSKLKRANYTMSVCSDSYPVPCNSDHTSAQSNFSRLLATHPIDGHWAAWSRWTSCSTTCGTGHKSRTRSCTSPRPSGGGQYCTGTDHSSATCLTRICPVNGGWSTWTTWGNCDKSCDTGHQSRTRNCTHPAPKYGGANCTGTYLSTKTCLLKHCPVNGHWGSWSSYGACSVTCGQGYKLKHRSCNHPTPSYGGHTCPGSPTYSLKCSLTACPVDGHWGSWSAYGACAVTCGSGKKTRHRSCDKPAPAHGGHTCSGSSTSDTTCLLGDCPVDGHWGSWSSYGACTVTCGTGKKARHRSCDSPAPAHGGHSCSGSSTSDTTCSLAACPVNGQWGTWSAYGACSVTCGAGKKARQRSCDSPAPAHGGHSCSGSLTSDTTCSLAACPVNGQWGTWSAYGACSVTCGAGNKVKHRSCDSPVPAHGGHTCSGSSTSQSTCSLGDCPVDGQWATWTSWGTCSVTCGSGMSTRTRGCHAPQYGGRPCNGHSTDQKICTMDNCPVDGHWNSWSEYGTCDVTCGTGSQSRSRTCHEPRYGGKPCIGQASGTRSCNMTSCPVDGRWTTWSEWGTCDVTCSTGSQSRSRTCHEPRYGGKPCSGHSSDTKTCTMSNCPVDGRWNTWSDWGKCEVTCGSGSQTRSRMCHEPKYGGKPCVGSRTSTKDCTMVACPVDGHWSTWSDWATCDVTCGTGTHIRSRDCTNPSPKNGGRQCVGESTDTEECEMVDCPVDGGWGHWTAYTKCSQTCGGGQQARSRSCDNPTPKYGGKQCLGQSQHTQQCGTAPCIVDGVWSTWQAWSKCSVTCAGGNRTRTRQCDNPAPKNGGADCKGDNSGTEHCNTEACPTWSGWFAAPCSVTCGSGTLMRLRHCSSGTDSDCGSGNAFENLACMDQHCPVDGNWGAWKEWTTCSASCDQGTRSRSRDCDDPAPKYGGKQCVGSGSDEGMCQIKECPHWSSWQNVGKCSVTCGQGFVVLKRTCSTGNDADCTGSSADERPCILTECV